MVLKLYINSFTIWTASHKGAKREFPGSALESASEGAVGNRGAPESALEGAVGNRGALTPNCFCQKRGVSIIRLRAAYAET